MLTSRASALLSFLNLLFELDSRSPTRSCGSGSKNLTKKKTFCVMISLNYDLSQGIILSRAFSSHSSLQSVEHELESLRQYLDSQNWCGIV